MLAVLSLKIPKRNDSGLITGSDLTVWTVHSCNGCLIFWILVQFDTVSDLILFGFHCDLYFMVQ